MPRRLPDAKKDMGRICIDGFEIERDDNDDCFQECKVGSKDISDLVKKAVRAAEAEARAANAPAEAVRAAGDAAAEVVKTAALEVGTFCLCLFLPICLSLFRSVSLSINLYLYLPSTFSPIS